LFGWFYVKVGRELPGTIGKCMEAKRPSHGREYAAGELIIFSHFRRPFSMNFYQNLMVWPFLQGEKREIYR
jgi:hypothetical protein